ncbi:UNKNOWN [Stylonychia lemnae]|uniref:Uncharacterized protein n=1 Tax=Stylonychia lemnae TaxID=5949 RepID=A0A078BCI8_STYLE|nr:UNKNOWN [Stylonychia lemnae]|eukprot:CDW90922.1 UNKNOWN [Stylonychia lemnae]
MFQIKNCLDQLFTIQNQFSYFDTSTQVANFSYLSPTNQLFISLNITKHYDQFIGSRYVQVTASYQGEFQRNTTFMTNFIPPNYRVKQVDQPDHDFKNCSQKIYPLFWGESYNLKIWQSSLDQYGNILMAGSSNTLPFSDINIGNKQLYQGFVALFDQRGQPFWIYQARQISTATTNQTCLSVSQFETFVYALCTLKENDYVNKRSRVLVLLKFNHQNGILKYARNLPNNTDQQGDFVYGLQNGMALGLFRYVNQTTKLINQAALVYDDSIDTTSWYKLYNTSFQDSTFLEPTPRTYLVNRETGFFYIFESVPNKFFQTYKNNLINGQIELITRCTQVQNVAMGFFYAAFLGDYQIVQGSIDMLSNLNRAVLQIIQQSDLSLVKQLKLSFGKMFKLSSIAITVTDENIFVVFSFKSIVIAKFDKDLQLIKYVYFEKTFTSASILNIKFYGDELLYFFNTQTIPSNSSGKSIDLNSTDINWKIEADYSITTPNLMISNFSPGLNGNVTLGFMQFSTNLNWTSQSFSSNLVKRNDNGLSMIRFRQFDGTYHSPSPIQQSAIETEYSYEFKRNSGIPITLKVICSINNNENFYFTQLSYNSTLNKISVNTNMFATPVAVHVKEDENILIGGYIYTSVGQAANQATIYRFSQSSRLEWQSYISNAYYLSEIQSLVMQNDSIYATFVNNISLSAQQQALVKLTYSEVFQLLYDNQLSLNISFNHFLQDQSSTNADALNTPGTICFDLDGNFVYYTGFLKNKSSTLNPSPLSGFISKFSKNLITGVGMQSQIQLLKMTTDVIGIIDKLWFLSSTLIGMKILNTQVYFPSPSINSGNAPGSFKYLVSDTANVPCSEVNFPEFMMKQGQIGKYEIDALQVKHCQGTWIVTVLSTNDKNNVLPLPIYVWPASFEEVPKSESNDTCQGVLFPKVIGASLNDFTHYNSDMDLDNGNFLVCGASLASWYVIKDYPGQQYGVISLFGITGKAYWSYGKIKTNNLFILSQLHPFKIMNI